MTHDPVIYYGQPLITGTFSNTLLFLHNFLQSYTFFTYSLTHYLFIEYAQCAAHRNISKWHTSNRETARLAHLSSMIIIGTDGLWVSTLTRDSGDPSKKVTHLTLWLGDPLPAMAEGDAPPDP